jgi:predicted Zn-dependent peptidase
MTYQLTTLPSGLMVASETLPVESVAIAVSVGAGSRHEKKEENGVSHLLEHMAFKGTKTRSARDIAEAFDMIGGQSNAFTSTESTVYYAKVLKHDVRLATDILGDILQHPTFDPEELRREQDVVLQEIAMQRDTPEDLIGDYFDEASFPGQPLGRSILSTEEQVAGYLRDDLVRYMDTHYRPPRIALTAAGNIQHESLVALAQEYFALPAREAGPKYEAATYLGGEKRVAREFEQLHMMLGLPSVPVHSPDYYAMQIYANILGGGMSSRLFQEVREKRGLGYNVYAMNASYEDCGVMGIYAATAPDKAKELSRILCEQVRGMMDGVSDAELVRAKNQHKAELLMARENPQTVAIWIGRHLLMFGEYRQVSDIAARIDAVSRDDIVRVSEMVARGPLAVAALGDIAGIPPYEKLTAALRG